MEQPVIKEKHRRGVIGGKRIKADRDQTRRSAKDVRALCLHGLRVTGEIINSTENLLDAYCAINVLH